MTIADGGRGVGAAIVVVERVVGNQLELRLGGDDVRAFALRDEIELAVREHGRGVDQPGVGLEPFLPNRPNIGRRNERGSKVRILSSIICRRYRR